MGWGVRSKVLAAWAEDTRREELACIRRRIKQAWTQHIDPNTGRSFFYNEISRISKWTLSPCETPDEPGVQPEMEGHPMQVEDVPEHRRPEVEERLEIETAVAMAADEVRTATDVEDVQKHRRPGVHLDRLGMVRVTGTPTTRTGSSTDIERESDMTDISLLRPATVTDLVPVAQDEWTIECAVDVNSGQLWPVYRHRITGPQWTRPDAVSIARAAADFECSLGVWRTQYPEEVVKVEKAGIVRDFTWGLRQ